MLARSAEGLYWMGRYLERADHLCRMLRLQAEALVDRPLPEIHFGWARIYESLERLPPRGSLEMVRSDEYTLADSYVLADDLTFESSNPESIWSCFARGRENARNMRHYISGEMWIRLNLAYLRIQKLDINEIWRTSPESFYAETSAEINTFMGTADATMYRDLGWRFMQLGRFIERAQLGVSLLLTQIALDVKDSDHQEAEWTSLLRIHHAVEAYMRGYGVEVQSQMVLDLLVTDPLLPHSLCHSIERIMEELVAIGPGTDQRAVATAQRLAGNTGTLIRYAWLDAEDKEGLLERVYEDNQEIHGLLSAGYFHNLGVP